MGQNDTVPAPRRTGPVDMAFKSVIGCHGHKACLCDNAHVCILPSTKPARSVSRFSRAGGRGLMKKTIRQHCSMTPASAEVRLRRVCFSQSDLHHSNYMQVLRSVLG